MANHASISALNGALLQKEHLHHELTAQQRPQTAAPSSKAAALSPAPAFLGPAKSTQDDSFIPYPPMTPKRPGFARGLSLQLPPDAAPPKSSHPTPTPLAAKLDAAAASALGSPSGAAGPASVLPRRSRGLDFTRACTSLHHSTRAEQSSPDSSPVIGGKAIPNARRHGPSGPGSPMFPGGLWTGAAGSHERRAARGLAAPPDNTALADTDSDESSSDGEDEVMRGVEDDPIHMTPQPMRPALGPRSSITAASPGTEAFYAFSPSAATLRGFRHRQRRGRRQPHSSSSNSGHSSRPSPGPASPAVMHSIESGVPNGLSGATYLQREREKQEIQSRRQSLSLGTHALNLSDTLTDEPQPHPAARDALGLAMSHATPPSAGAGAGAGADETKPTIRRVMTRRSNLLVSPALPVPLLPTPPHTPGPPVLSVPQPKSKGFSRIRAALQEESAPVDFESRREAEVIRQVRESDASPPGTAYRRPSGAAAAAAADASQSATATSSPLLVPASAHPSEPPSIDDLSELFTRSSSNATTQDATLSGSTAASSQADPFGFVRRHNSSGSLSRPPHRPSTSSGPAAAEPTEPSKRDSIMSLDSDAFKATPPPPPFFSRGASAAVSDDVMSTEAGPAASTAAQAPAGAGPYPRPSSSRASTPQPHAPAGDPGPARRALGKRRRDDDLDPQLFKRRAVSPGVSLQNSPVLPPSPAAREAGTGGSGWWPGRGGREAPSAERAGSNSSAATTSGCGGGGPRRVGMQGMQDANDALMNLGIE